MRLRRLSVRLAGLALFGLFAASSIALEACSIEDCPGACRQWQVCGAYAGRDCAQICDDIDNTVSDGKCTSEWADLTSCVAGDDEVCRADDAKCSVQNAEFSSCIINYCVKRTDDPGCIDIFSQKPLLTPP